LTSSELVAHETALVTGPIEEVVATAGVLAALETGGLAVTVVVAGVAGWLADEEQPATAARQMSAAVEAASGPAAEKTALGNTGVPFVCTAPRAPSSNYDDRAGPPVGATPERR
jgi:hypothetical protein